MKWLLVFVWTVGADVHITTEQFDTLAECAVTANVLNGWDYGLQGARKSWRCSKLVARLP